MQQAMDQRRKENCGASQKSHSAIQRIKGGEYFCSISFNRDYRPHTCKDHAGHMKAIDIGSPCEIAVPEGANAQRKSD